MKMFSDIIEHFGESEIIRITLNMYLLSIKSFGVRTVYLCQPVVNYLSQEHLWRLAGVQMTAVAIREN